MARILLIDDDESLRRPLERVLLRSGYEVSVASDGVSGLRMWREVGADLIITDLCMPRRTGLEVIIEIQALAPGAALLAMSGGFESGTLDLLGSASQAGAVRTLAKPFTLEELLAVVRELLAPESELRPSGGPSLRRPPGVSNEERGAD
ncbi:MAG: response regulator [Gemmatimonadales bacterium]